MSAGLGKWGRAAIAAATLALASPALAQPATIATLQAEPAVWPTGTWAGWKAAFLRADGRVVDNGNGDISHSEGQGYGMLLAVMAGDRAAFDSLYAFTTTELMKRPDGLASWKWEADKFPRVTDPNNASDGDLLIAWALAEAAARWQAPAYQAAAVTLATALDRATGARSGFGRVMLPGVDGFTAAQRPDDGPVVNLSYWVFPALERLKSVAPGVDWDGYRASGHTLLKALRAQPGGLPTDWTSIRNGKVAPAAGFPPTYSYNAIRIPLYLAWARQDGREALAPFLAHFAANGDKAMEYDAEKKTAGAPMSDAGYAAVYALAKCAVKAEKIPLGLRSVSFDRYYPATLHMLSLAAARLRFETCL